MNAAVLFLALASAVVSAPSISGHVVDAAGAPIPGARVFLECGVGGALVEARSDASGAFRFDNPALGVAGVAAVAEGFAFGGATVTVAVDDVISDVAITLRRPQTVSGKVVDPRGNPVSGARITRVLILGDRKVGIPFAKLKALGFEEPVSDAEGRFAIPGLPEGGTVALKVGHPEFAQAGVTDVAVGRTDVRVSMSPGVLVRGQAVSRDRQVPVANAQIIFTRAVAPFDTILARTGPGGDYIVRLEPGPYVAQAAGAEFRTPAGEKVNISGSEPEVKVTLRVAGTGAIAGTVADAVSGKPVDGAKLVLTANGSTAAHVFTGPTGQFRVEAAEGENIVRLDTAPGFLLPPRASVRVTVTQGEEAVLPTFWVTPIPAYRVQVVGEDGRPVPGAIVTVLRPAQFGWYATDAEGHADLRLASVPADGRVVGLAEHPSQPLGAVFAIERSQAADAKVQLLPLGRVEGEVVGRGSKKLPGAVVGAVLAEAPFPEPLVLWQTLAGDEGRFAWNSTVPLAPLKCVAKATDRKTGEEKAGESAPVTLEPAGRHDLGRIVVTEGRPGESLLGKSLRWQENRRLGGPAPGARGPAVVLYCGAEEATAVIEGLGAAERLLAGRGIAFAAVVGSPVDASTATIPVYQGSRPGPATTYVIGADGKVVLETFGLPPLRALQSLTGGGS